MIVSGTERHNFVCVDPATHRVIWINKNGEIVRQITNAFNSFDVFALPNGQVLYPHFGHAEAPSDGFSLVNEDGSVALVYHTKNEVFSCQPLPDGNVLVGESGIFTDPVKKDEIDVKAYTQYTVDDVVIAGGLTHLYSSLRNNVIYDTDPGFTTIGKVKDALSESSQIYRDIIDFEKIPFESIGIEK